MVRQSRISFPSQVSYRRFLLYVFGTAALNALYKLAIHVIVKHYIATTPWAALVQNHIDGLFCVEK